MRALEINWFNLVGVCKVFHKFRGIRKITAYMLSFLKILNVARVWVVE